MARCASASGAAFSTSSDSGSLRKADASANASSAARLSGPGRLCCNWASLAVLSRSDSVMPSSLRAISLSGFLSIPDSSLCSFATETSRAASAGIVPAKSNTTAIALIILRLGEPSILRPSGHPVHPPLSIGAPCRASLRNRHLPRKRGHLVFVSLGHDNSQAIGSGFQYKSRPHLHAVVQKIRQLIL